MPIPPNAPAARTTRRLLPLVLAAALAAVPHAARAQMLGGQTAEVGTAIPMSRVPVRLLRLVGGAAEPSVVDSTRSDVRGLFQIVAPEPGVYQLEFGPVDAPLARGPVDTLAADAQLMRRYDLAVTRDEAKPYFEFQVEEPVRPLHASSGPEYPADLREQQIEGVVLAQFVVDVTGRVEPSSFRVLRSADPGFTRAVRTAVLAMRYRPARVAGRNVRQLVQQPFEFRLANGLAPRPDA